jgi:Arc/MetJ-type ribon-helix-helix transcriptional regulator
MKSYYGGFIMVKSEFNPSMVRRISISLDEEILKWIDSRVDGYRYKDRSHLIQCAIIDLRKSEELKKS